MKCLLFDNYDSFTYNLRHMLLELGLEVDVRRNGDRKETAAAYPDYDWNGLWQKSRPMIGAGYMKEENGRLFFTPKGFLLSNSILARIL